MSLESVAATSKAHASLGVSTSPYVKVSGSPPAAAADAFTRAVKKLTAAVAESRASSMPCSSGGGAKVTLSSDACATA